MVGGAITLAYNVAGVDWLTLTPDIIAGIFNNTITKWNDPKSSADNPGVTLPDDCDPEFHRSDGSGTTDNFTKYLAAAAPSVWTTEPGKEWKAPGGQGAKGSDGVTQGVKGAEGTVGYAEFSYATNASLGVAKVKVGDAFVELTPDTAAAGVASAEVIGKGNDLKLKLNYTPTTPDTYPIVAVTYHITCEKGLPAAEADFVRSFMGYAASDAGQGVLTEIDYAPLPPEIAPKVQAAIAAIAA